MLFYEELVLGRCAKQMETDLGGQLTFIAVDPKEPDLK